MQDTNQLLQQLVQLQQECLYLNKQYIASQDELLKYNTINAKSQALFNKLNLTKLLEDNIITQEQFDSIFKGDV